MVAWLSIFSRLIFIFARLDSAKQNWVELCLCVPSCIFSPFGRVYLSLYLVSKTCSLYFPQLFFFLALYDPRALVDANERTSLHQHGTGSTLLDPFSHFSSFLGLLQLALTPLSLDRHAHRNSSAFRFRPSHSVHSFISFSHGGVSRW